MSLEVKPVSNFLIYLAQNCIKRSLTHPNDFRNSFFGTFPYVVKKILRYISVHGDMQLIFFDLRILDFVFCVSQLTDSRKRNKLNGKVSDLPDRISSVLNVPLSNINVGGYNSVTNAVIET